MVYETWLEGFDTGRRFYLIKSRHVIPSELPEASFTVTGEEQVSPGHKVILRIKEKFAESLCKKCSYFSPLTATPHCLKSSKVISNQAGPQVSSLLSFSLAGCLTDREICSLPAFCHVFSRVQGATTNKARPLISDLSHHGLHISLTHSQTGRGVCWRSSLALTDQRGGDQNCLSQLPIPKPAAN